MSLPTLDDVPPATVVQLQAEMAAMLVERYPDLDLSTNSALDGLVTYLHGVAGGVYQVSNEQQLAARSLFLATTDPDSVDTAAVDLILSNFRITRLAGKGAAGEVLIVVNTNAITVIPTGATFATGSLVFQTTADYVARPDGATLISSRDRTLRPYPGGLYSFAVPVSTTSEGAGGNIKRGTVMTMSRPPGNVVRTQANIDFIGGRIEETNAAMLQRLETGIAGRGWGGRTNIRAMLLAQEEFELQALTIIGINEPEQLRDRHSIIPIGSGGKLDIYVKTASRPTNAILQKTATCVAVNVTDSSWQMAFGATEAPGFYSVEEIVDTVSGQVGNIVQDTRFVSNPGFDRVSDIKNGLEVAYTAFQGASINFTLPRTAAVGDARAVRVTVSLMPHLDDIQRFCSGYSTGMPAGDVVVRAAITCEVQVGMRIYAPTGSLVDGDSVASAVAGFINGTGFIGQLSGADLAYAAKQVLPSDYQIGEIAMVGSIRAPDGTTVSISAPDVLRAPSLPELMVTERTVTFICDPGAVGVDVTLLRTP